VTVTEPMSDRKEPTRVSEHLSGDVMPDARIAVEDLTVSYDGVVAVDGVSLEIEPGEFVSLLGPSGSGKTTILKTVAGFQSPTAGRICVNGRVINDDAPRFRNFGMVFQNYALFPHMTIERNVAFGLRVRRMSKTTMRNAIEEILDLVGLSSFAGRYPTQLSGGQQQRVALARAIVIRPQLLLMDEPLAALDLKLRQQLQLDIRRIQKQLGISTLYVTHDQEEALTLSDKVVVMEDGKISSAGTAAEIYHRPSTRFVATFVGNKTVIPVEPASAASGTVSGLPGQQGTLTLDATDAHRATYVVLQPEDISSSRTDSPGAVAGVVTGRRFLGKTGLVTVETADHVFHVNDRGLDAQQGDTIHLTWPSEQAHVIHEDS
jgi:ABC-type Fe3+/spermidine/putrescine transport system ATPase subunit